MRARARMRSSPSTTTSSVFPTTSKLPPPSKGPQSGLDWEGDLDFDAHASLEVLAKPDPRVASIQAVELPLNLWRVEGLPLRK